MNKKNCKTRFTTTVIDTKDLYFIRVQKSKPNKIQVALYNLKIKITIKNIISILLIRYF